MLPVITGTTCPFYWNKYEASILFVPLIANRKPRSWAICAQFCQLYFHRTHHCTQAEKIGGQMRPSAFPLESPEVLVKEKFSRVGPDGAEMGPSARIYLRTRRSTN
jgi:hypothetical protein